MPKSGLRESVKGFLGYSRTWAALALLPLTGWLAWRFGPGLWALVRDETALREYIARLGWPGPLALIVINAVQIVVAPIPGYLVQGASGFLFGPLWGGVWGSLGLLIGATLAMLLARLFGRPLAERFVGAERLARWERTTHSDSALVWWLILMAPVGDIVYFLAGLSQVSIVKVLALTLISRVPFTFLVAAAAAGVTFLPWWQLVLILLVLVLLFWITTRYQDRLLGWIDRQVGRRLS
jgi:uncharacterized membrane protein YdjX (TVP38/TMEM64 family)